MKICLASQNIRKAQLPQLKKARSEGKVAYFRHTKLIIKDKTTPSGATAEASGQGIPGIVCGTDTAAADNSIQYTISLAYGRFCCWCMG